MSYKLLYEAYVDGAIHIEETHEGIQVYTHQNQAGHFQMEAKSGWIYT